MTDDGWWERLYNDDTDTNADAQPAGEKRLNIKLTRTRPENEPLPDAARAMLPADPRAAARLRWAAYNAGAAAAGWWIGAEQWCTNAITASGRASVPEGVWVGVGLILVTLPLEVYAHRLRGPGAHPAARCLGWIARIPLASAVIALALYGPNAAL